MNCNRARRWILLETAREIPRSGMRGLRTHLDACRACRAFRRDAARLTLAVAERTPAAPLPPAVRRRILHSADGMRNRRAVQRLFPGLPVWACAAALALLLAGWKALVPREPPFDRIGDLHAILALLEQEDSALETQDRPAFDTSLRALAEQLLRLEDLAAEESADYRLLLTESDPAGEHSSTTLRWRSTDAPLPKRGV